MDQEVFIAKNKYISSKRSADLYGYTYDYLSRLARQGIIKGKRFGRAWYLEEGSLKHFIESSKNDKDFNGAKKSKKLKKEYTRNNTGTINSTNSFKAISDRPIFKATGHTLSVYTSKMPAVIYSKPFEKIITLALAGSLVFGVFFFQKSHGAITLGDKALTSLENVIESSKNISDSILSEKAIAIKKIKDSSEYSALALGAFIKDFGIEKTYSDYLNLVSKGMDSAFIATYRVPLEFTLFKNKLTLFGETLLKKSDEIDRSLITISSQTVGSFKKSLRDDNAMPSLTAGIISDLSSYWGSEFGKVSRTIYCSVNNFLELKSNCVPPTPVKDKNSNALAQKPVDVKATTTPKVVAKKIQVPVKEIIYIPTPVAPRVTERVVSGGITLATLQFGLESLREEFLGELNSKLGNINTGQDTIIQNVYTSIAQTNNIDRLQAITIIDPIITGGSITNTEISGVFSGTITGATTFSGVGINTLLATNSSGMLSGTSTPVVANIIATSTTATSTLAGDVSIGGLTGLYLTGNGGGITFTGSGNHDISATGGTLRIGSNTIIGNIQALDNTIDIGTPGTRFDKIYADEVNASTIVGTLTGGNLTAETFNINSDNVSADTEDSFLSFERGTLTPNALIQYDSSRKLFDLNNPLFVQNDNSTTTIITLDVRGVSGQTANIFNVASSTGTSIFAITSSGNVGIATTSPYASLSVAGHTGVVANIYTATSTTATSTFAGGFTVATSGLVYDRSTSNVGIGTTAPAGKLHVVGTTAGYMTFDSVASNYITYKEAGTVRGYIGIGDGVFSGALANSFGIRAEGALQLGSGVGADVTIDTTGNVGIGTTNPLSNLHVKDFSGSATYGSSDTLRVDGGGSGLRGEIHLTDGVTSDAFISFLPSSTAASRRLSLSAGPTESHFVIQGDGNVGIGTTSPVSKLSVVGESAFAGGASVGIGYAGTAAPTGGMIIQGNVGIGTTTPNNILDIYSTSKSAIGFSGASGTTNKWTIGMDVSNGGRFSIASSTALGTTDRFVIDGNGNVGIGTTGPGAKLELGSGQIFVPVGSIGAPSYSFTGNTNGGMYMQTSPASQLAFSSNGIKWLTVDGNGVGIGLPAATNADNRLNIYGVSATGRTSIKLNSGTSGVGNRITFTDGFTYNYAFGTTDNTNGDFVWEAGGTPSVLGTERMRLTQGGNVGIGTTSPYASLSVAGHSGVVANIFIATSTTATSTFAGGLAVETSGLVYDYSSNNVGIATSSPSRKLSVSGDIYLTGGLGVGLVNTTVGSISTTANIRTDTSLITGAVLNCNAASSAVQTDGTGTLTCGSISAIGGTSAGGWTWITPDYVRLATTSDRLIIGSSGSPVEKVEIHSGSVATTTLGLHPAASQTANILSIYNTSGSIASVFTAGHKFGIGETAPVNELHISGANSPGIRVTDSDNGVLSTDGLFIQQANTDTFIWNYESGFMDFATAGASRMRILSSGFVGIGNTSPNERLNVQGTIAGQVLQATSTTATSTFAGGLAIETSGLVYDYSSNNVGIGTTGPGAPLHILKSGSGSQIGLAIQNNTIVDGAEAVIDLITNAQVPGFRSAQIAGINVGGTNNMALAFRTESGATPTTRMYIDPTGNVGIGTTTPGTLLTLAGDGTSGASQLALWNGVQDARLTFYPNNGAQTAAISGGSNGSVPNLAFLLGGTERVKIQNDGNVGIGTTSPYASLSVVGSTGVVANIFTATSTTVASTIGAGGLTIGGTLAMGTSNITSTGSLGATGARLTAGFFTDLTVTNAIAGSITGNALTATTLQTARNINGVSFNGGADITVTAAAGTLTGATLASNVLASSLTSVGTLGALTVSGATNLTGLLSFANASGTQLTTTGSTYLATTGGNVGIGTTGPTEKLDVTGSILSSGGFQASGGGSAGTPAFRIGADTGMFLVGGGNPGFSAGGVLQWDYNTTRMNLKSGYNLIVGGNVGIGTTSPYSKLSLHANDGETNLTLFAIASSTATATSTHFAVRNTGNVGIGTSTPGYKLTVASAGSLTALIGTASTDGLVIGGGLGKITVGTIDPPYEIGSGKYATYVSGMVGQKEETTGTANISEQVTDANGNVGYKYEIDFDTQETGSDLWLFAKTTEIRKNIDKLVTLLTAEGDSKVWYKIDKHENKIVLLSTKPTKVSFRFTAPRFDSASWTNLREESLVGFSVPEYDDNVYFEAEGTTTLDFSLPELPQLTFSNVLDSLASAGLSIVNGITKITSLIADNLIVGSPEKPSGITLYDEVTGNPYCLSIRNGATFSNAGTCASLQNGSNTSGSSTPPAGQDTESPVITIIGNNPANIAIGSIYVDLGATVTDNIDQNLGITASVDGVEVGGIGNIVVDTSVMGEHTVSFVATDNVGNSTTVSRIVIVESQTP